MAEPSERAKSPIDEPSLACPATRSRRAGERRVAFELEPDRVRERT